MNNLKVITFRLFFCPLMKLNKKQLTYWLITLVIAIFISIISINFYVLSFWKNKLHNDVSKISNKKVWLVLWASVKANKEPSDILKDRLDVAYDTYESWKISRLILSWDNSLNEYNEPVAMQKYLLEKWVEEEHMYLDYAWFDTYDSIYRAKFIFWVEKLVIFTQQYHLIRSIYIWEKLWLSVSWVMTDNQSYVWAGYFKFREIFARVKAFLDADILKSDPKFFWEKIDINYEDSNELKLKKILNNIDLENDNSLSKFVNNKVSFSDVEYIPDDLIDIDSPLIVDLKWYWTLRKEAKHALWNMSKDFYGHFKEKISVLSSYRSYKYQKWIKDRWCPDNLCAKAWYSEHQSWLAVDFWEASTQEQFLSNKKYKEYFKWLRENAHNYWFHNTYQKWLDIDWYEIEPWHWRYIWIEFATYLKEQDITIAEFYDKVNKK